MCQYLLFKNRVSAFYLFLLQFLVFKKIMSVFMKWDIYGPLIVWSLMFFVGSFLQYIAFDKAGVFYNLPPDLALWAVGILFTICVSEGALNKAKIATTYTKKKNGLGYMVDYDITLPENITSGSKMMYLFLIVICIWIVSLLLSGSSQESMEALSASAVIKLNQSYFVLMLSYFLSFLSVGLALHTLNEVSQ